MEILGNLAKDDKQSSEQIYEVLKQCLKNAENAKNNIELIALLLAFSILDISLTVNSLKPNWLLVL